MSHTFLKFDPATDLPERVGGPETPRATKPRGGLVFIDLDAEWVAVADAWRDTPLSRIFEE
ncbi:hypothetical protein GCM10007933_17660 [Zoogloea oryzae]|uniref:Uncharacterized protein n=1 Tax=Zoogloea oryzae TaxID=310767 RepID=A0ABQ6FAQ7_9RHOO|nr:hypothetical protein [Zoogloea oryzae]GLT22307.1 hypothetical protein GCM10007933_17660 [Zoogloea oryzae]